ncbi:hypothetical protein PT974_01493 [Cladobotryum mycophilum]|uniref:Uncharacterized protein n=1 Tax=Cladobotryum mycophilum TaxID=491253 RepID=A0ABR0T3W9_9HYPO
MNTPFQHHLLHDLLRDHPVNPVNDTELLPGPAKPGLAEFPPITHFYVQTYQQPGGSMCAKFDAALLPEYDDDALRMSFGAYPSNPRAWSLASEEDCRGWFDAEISNIVLAAWGHYPGVISVSQPTPASNKVINGLGVIKQNVIDVGEWLVGSLFTYRQRQLSRELREYAYAYDCPQVFCFDGKSFLMLQFRVDSPEFIKDPDCPVDCWVFPRDNVGGCAIRYAFYRLMAQGLRRYQSFWPLLRYLADVPIHSRVFFNGQPIWRVGRYITQENPDGYVRQVDRNTGSFYWKYVGPWQYPERERPRTIDTGALWNPPSR